MARPSIHSGRPARRAVITPRALAIGAILTILTGAWVGMVEGVWHSLHFTCLSLPMNLLFTLFLLAGLNVALRRIRPEMAFSAAELLAIYAMLSLATVLFSHDNLVGLMGVLPYAAHFATPENGWATRLLPLLPPSLVVNDRAAAYDFFAGHSDFWSTGYYAAWLRPAGMWSALLFTLVFTMLCLNVLLRQRWTEAEKLSYPIIQLPLAMAYQPGFYRQGWFWIGFAVVALIDLLNALHYCFPFIPGLGYRGPDLLRYVVNRPWNAIGSTLINGFPLVIGFAFLLPQDLAVSCWVFYLLGDLQCIYGSAFGIGGEDAPGFPYFPQQAGGAFLAIVGVVLWQSRGYLRQVWRRARQQSSELDDSREAFRYRSALLGLGLGLLALSVFCHLAGMSAWVIAAFFVLYFLLALAVARLRAELGAPSHAIYHVNPQQMLIPLLGSETFARRDLAGLGLLFWFNRFNRSHPMPQELEAFKIAEVIEASHRRMAGALLLATVIALATAFVIYPTLLYRHGAATFPGEVLAAGSLTFNSLAGWLDSPRPPDPVGAGFFLGGGLFALLLSALRTWFLGWRLHPLGYALAMSGAVDTYWFALLLTTLVKGFIVRYFGVRGYRQARPFFLGLILGQYVVACLTSFVGLALGKPMYEAWP